MIDRVARTLVERLLARIRRGTVVVVEDGRRRVFGSGPPAALVAVHDRRLWRMLLRGGVGLADAYAEGMWDSPDLVALIRVAARNASTMDEARARLAPVRVPIQRLRGRGRPSGRRQRRRDIAAHYDLGRELFARMLDPSMTYSCALFERPDLSLEAAQRAKLELICAKLELGPRDRVLEIGSGWGALALHAAATRGCHVTTTTISADQHAYTREQVRRAGLEDRVTVLAEDYRDLRGRYDKLISIEMIEAVGWRDTGAFLGTCSRLLEPHGAMLLQAITIDDRAFEVEKASRSFMKERIFPGGSLPSLAVLTGELARHSDLQVVSLQDLTPHYVTTLQHWRRRFLDHVEELARLGYDERFRRLWELYLAYCEAGFAERRIGDVQLLLAKPRYAVSELRPLGDPIGDAQRTHPQRPDPRLPQEDRIA